MEIIHQSSRAETVDIDVAAIEQLRQSATTFVLPDSEEFNLKRVRSHGLLVTLPPLGLLPLARPRSNTAPPSEVVGAKK